MPIVTHQLPRREGTVDTPLLKTQVYHYKGHVGVVVQGGRKSFTVYRFLYLF